MLGVRGREGGGGGGTRGFIDCIEGSDRRDLRPWGMRRAEVGRRGLGGTRSVVGVGGLN